MMIPPVIGMVSVRPVFWILMAICLVLFAWRLCRGSGPWTARLLMAGAVLLGLGYGVLLPLAEAGVIRPSSAPGATDSQLAWQAVRTLVMNVGWLLLGAGLACHARGLTAVYHSTPNALPPRHDPREPAA